MRTGNRQSTLSPPFYLQVNIFLLCFLKYPDQAWLARLYSCDRITRQSPMNPIGQRLIICRAIREVRATSLEDVHARRYPKSTCIIYPRLPSHDNLTTEPFQIPVHLGLRPSTLPRQQARTLLHRSLCSLQGLIARKSRLTLSCIIPSRASKRNSKKINSGYTLDNSIQTTNPR